ncbi:hypothetical protein AVEN_113066-1 [Araneus ventricosus]|uniref:Uncharacterized protein n=1 Tax=Araneus ventricosus TaxID=182803 RepID=A0A4Y2S7N0_ARAVE|nr:hypothetical protein AVEN_113066-1 [Araneus ventricosus]
MDSKCPGFKWFLERATQTGCEHYYRYILSLGIKRIQDPTAIPPRSHKGWRELGFPASACHDAARPTLGVTPGTSDPQRQAGVACLIPAQPGV